MSEKAKTKIACCHVRVAKKNQASKCEPRRFYCGASHWSDWMSRLFKAYILLKSLLEFFDFI